MVEVTPESVTFRSNGISYSHTQLPLQNAFALTIHKTQSLSLNKVCIALDSTMFCAGQAYTALSRARRWTDVSIMSFEPGSIQVDQEAVNEYDRLENIAKHDFAELRSDPPWHSFPHHQYPALEN